MTSANFMYIMFRYLFINVMDLTERRKNENKLKRKRTPNTKSQQYELYLQTMENDHIFRAGAINPSMSDNYIENKWEELASKLNNMGSGPKLTTEEWKKRFNDWKNSTRSKYRKILENQLKPGGGPHSEITLSTLEERGLNVWGRFRVSNPNKVFNDCGRLTILPIPNPGPPTVNGEVEEENDYFRRLPIIPRHSHPRLFPNGLNGTKPHPEEDEDFIKRGLPILLHQKNPPLIEEEEEEDDAEYFKSEEYVSVQLTEESEPLLQSSLQGDSAPMSPELTIISEDAEPNSSNSKADLKIETEPNCPKFKKSRPPNFKKLKCRPHFGDSLLKSYKVSLNVTRTLNENLKRFCDIYKETEERKLQFEARKLEFEIAKYKFENKDFEFN